eukprot:8607452-Pyramimonas_sp.AAC.1
MRPPTQQRWGNWVRRQPDLAPRETEGLLGDDAAALQPAASVLPDRAPAEAPSAPSAGAEVATAAPAGASQPAQLAAVRELGDWDMEPNSAPATQ